MWINPAVLNSYYVRNNSVPGNTTNAIRARITHMLIADRYDYMAVVGGGNNFRLGGLPLDTQVSETVNDLRVICTSLENHKNNPHS